MKTDISLITILIVALVVFAFGGLLLPFFIHPSAPHAQYTVALSNLKQVGTASIIYLADYDDRYPHTTAMPGTRVCLLPYTKNAELFKAIDKISDEPTYNFNLSGSVATDPPLGYKNPFDPKKIAMWYSFLKNTKTPEAILVSTDTAAKRVPQTQVYDALQYQFDRTGVPLAPTDYLASQDPLK